MILELQNAILEMIAKGEPLAATLNQLCLKVEAVIPGVTASILRFDGKHLFHLAGATDSAKFSEMPASP